MDFRHLIVTCLFSMLRLSFEAQKIKENYAILRLKRPYSFPKRSKCFPEKKLVFCSEEANLLSERS